MASIEHFELPADDVDRALSFYGSVFGFTFDRRDDDNAVLRTGSDVGIGGGIQKRAEAPHPTVFITVESIEDTIDAVIAAGGERYGEIVSLGGSARYGYFRDSEGNMMGVYDNGPAA